ncbi:MAG: 50S ribosome-binding GTPase [Terriglobus roseus]|nr:50S ribosome-binding GTPase [Terriglobus roseus]
MYHLFKGLYLYATSKEEYSILVLGLDNAGKTTLLEQIKALQSHHHPNLKTVPTVGQNVSTVTLPDMYLKVWDVGGQHSLRGLWHSYYASCHAIVFVIDSTDVGDGDIAKLAERQQQQQPRATRDGSASNGDGSGSSSSSAAPAAGARPDIPARSEELGRLEECRMVLEDVLQHEDADGVPVLVLANKQDREDCVEVVRIKEGLVRRVLEGEKGGSVRDSRVLPCSALTGTGVQEAVEWVCSRVKWNKEARPPRMVA